MKKQFGSYISFSRRERTGIITLLVLILILLSSSYWLKFCMPARINTETAKLNTAWLQLQENPKAGSGVTTISAELFPFDPNTMDSPGFVRLGLRPRTIHYLLNWRNKGKHFYAKEDLKPLYSLSDAEYARIEPYIEIAVSQRPAYYKEEYRSPLPAHIDLNKIDSATLVRLNGIGSVLAHKIVEHRAALGGFLKHEQLLEVYRFPDTTFTYLKEKLMIYPENIQKLSLNQATEEQFGRHPYIGGKMAHNIILLRKGLSKYEKLEQLRQVPLMNEEKYRKIAPYCTID